MDNNSFLEYFKVFTPFIIAFIVYIVWHFQKSNEVLANESKNLIKQMNETILLTSETMDLLRDASIHHGNTPDGLSTLKNKLADFKINIKTTSGTLGFLSEAIGNKELEDLNYDYWIRLNKVCYGFSIEINRIEQKAVFQEKDDENILTLYNNVVDICNRVKKSYMGYAMYRNSWLLKQTKKINVKVAQKNDRK